MQAASSNRLGLYMQTLASQPLHQGPAATVLLLDSLHQAVGQAGAAPSLAAVYSEAVAGALAQLGGAAGASLAALPVLVLADANSNTLDEQLLKFLGQVSRGCHAVQYVASYQCYGTCTCACLHVSSVQMLQNIRQSN